MNIRLCQPFTMTEQRVADGIRRGLDYGAIGKELAALRGRRKPVSRHTVRVHVRHMAQKVQGAGDLPPRWAIYVALLQQN